MNLSERVKRRAVTGFVVSMIAWAVGAGAAPAEVLWIEGESAGQSTMNRHPWYDQVKREHFSNRDFISNFNREKTGEAGYEFQARTAGPYTLWVRANPVQASMAYRLNGGPWQPIDLSKGALGSENVAADGKPDLRFIAWFNVGTVRLQRGRNLIAFRMDSKNSNHGYLDCFVLTDEPFEPHGPLKPDEIAQAMRRAAEENRGWFFFRPSATAPSAAPGALDLRELNEQFAGQHGWIRAAEGRFVHEKTGEPVRFWAVNGSLGDLKDREELSRCARRLAKYGVNLVRLHGGCFDDRGHVDPAKVRRAIETVEAMKAEGIYSHLSIYFPLWLKPQADCEFLEGYDGTKYPFAALMFNPRFQEQYRGWWKALLTTPSPTTGKRLVDEPALFGAEIQNEDSYFFWTFAARNLPEPQLRLLESQFAAWLERKYGSLDAAIAAWNGQRERRDAPGEGRMAFRPLWNLFHERTARDRDTARFLAESQRRFYEETYAFLRSLGFKGLITASNWTTASAEFFGPIEKYTYTAGDFIDRHGYFGCNLQGEHAGWSIRDGYTYSDRSALRFEPEKPGGPKLFTHPAMDPHYAGKPSMISETTFCRPNRYRSEAPLFYAAYGALQASDAIVHFALDGIDWKVKPRFFMQPWTLCSPAMMGQFPAAALVYRKALVAEGDVMVDLRLRIDDLLQLKGTPLPQDAALDELRLADVPQGAARKPDSLIDPLVHLVGRTQVAFTEQAEESRVADLAPFIDRRRQLVISSNRQLRLDYGKGVLVIDAPAAQGLCGALKTAGPTRLGDIEIDSDLELGAIVAVSLDGLPLARSRRILLQAMSEEKATGFRTEPAGNDVKRILSIGTDPWMVRELSGTVRFRRADAAHLRVQALDHSGAPAESAGVAASINLRPSTIYYLIQTAAE